MLEEWRERSGTSTAAQPADGAEGLEWQWVHSPETWKAGCSILVCCLSCYRSEPDDLSTPNDPHALIAPFARRNYYRTAARMMGEVARGLETLLGVPRASIRIFCNSRIPEKPLLAASGMARMGKNSLAIAHGLGSMFIIAGAVIPLPHEDLQAEPVSRPADPCGACRRCIDACPVGAISPGGVVDPLTCLQGLAAQPVSLSPELMEKWGMRLYGCQDCQSACPHNSRLAEEGPAGRGEIGPSVPLSKLLSMDTAELSAWFRGTAMGLSWISKEALTRNAIIAAGNSRCASLEPLVAARLRDGSSMIRYTARWAMERLQG